MHMYTSKIEEHMLNFYRSLSEKDRRRYAVVEAEKFRHGGISYMVNLFGCDPDTISAGRDDIEALPEDLAAGRVRKKGGTKNS